MGSAALASTLTALVLCAPAAVAQGAGPWSEVPLHPVGSGLPADVDGDGDQDAFAGSVWLENDLGDGSSWTTHATGLAFAPVAMADLDRDGDVDAVGATSWYENAAGDGSVWTEHALAVGETVAVRAVGDVDGDGDPDLVSFHQPYPSYRLAWLENAAGDGSTWVPRTILEEPGGESIKDVGVVLTIAVADLDADGDLDVVSHLPGSLFGVSPIGWLENTAGDGSAWSWSTIGLQKDPGRIRCADVDGDGTTDVLSAERTGGGPPFALDLFRNVAGDGSSWLASEVASGPWIGLTAADLDRDGDVDVAATRVLTPNDAEIAWLENVNGDGSSFEPHVVGTVPLTVMLFSELDHADLDGDGDLDLLAGLTDFILAQPMLSWWRNDAGHAPAIFCGQQSIDADVPGGTSVTAADVDGDGDLDAFSASRLDELVSFHENVSGDASTWSRTTVGTGDWPDLVSAADVDGDGDTDALAAFVVDGKLAWYENGEGDGSIWNERPLPSSLVSPRSARAADVDGDGDLDVVAGSLGMAGDATWYENLAGTGGSWTQHGMGTASGGAGSVAPADVDADGDVDAFTTNALGVVTWRENELGDGSQWGVLPVGTVSFTSTQVVASDVDGDGAPDCVVAVSFGSGLAWMENAVGQGGAWTAHTIPATGQSHVPVDSVDLDGDGDRDVLSAWLEGGQVDWYENLDGDGLSWTERALPFASTPALGVAAGDLNGDGDLDVLAVGNELSWVEHVRAASVESVRLGSPPNPDALRPGLTSGPAIGSTWDPWVDHASFLPAASFDLLALAAGPLNVPTSFGTVLCTPPLVTLVSTPGVPFAIAIGEDCSLLGIGLCCQAASYDGTLAATNALDIVLGTW